jgi:hypothetical protein
MCLHCKLPIEKDTSMNAPVLCSAKCTKDFFKGKTKSQKAEFLRSMMLSKQEEV